MGVAGDDAEPVVDLDHPPATSAETIAGRASMIDGDTLEIHGERIRILDIDAPESAQYCFKSSADLETGAWPCGRRAALALSDWIGQQTVTCDAAKKDRYRRWLARCDVRRVSQLAAG